MISEDISKNYSQENIEEIINNFKGSSHLTKIDHLVIPRMGGDYLLLYLANPTERFFKLLNRTLNNIPEKNLFKDRTTLKRRPESLKDRLKLPEAQLFRTVLSESLTADQHSLEEDFFARYVSSVFGAEEQIITRANHIVYGRRGSGKSSLLAYLMHKLRQNHSPYAWISLQTYFGRKDTHLIIIDVLKEIIEQLQTFDSNIANIIEIQPKYYPLKMKESYQENYLNFLLPKMKKAISKIANKYEKIFIFLDDIHEIQPDIQPILLSKLYSICRNNRTFLKISGIEQFTKTWEPSTHDVQIIRLDYNLTMLDKSMNYIKEILNANAVYCGLPDAEYLCGKGVLSRLVWVTAGVPRDAMIIFSQAMSRAALKDQKRVSITSINATASALIQDKINDIENETSLELNEIRELLEKIRIFCISEKRKNAFLVEIKNENQTFQKIEKLISLKLLHILHEGITPCEDGRRFKALMLDYGFYVGTRATPSVKIFHKEATKPVQAKELRKLPIFRLDKI